VVEGLLISARHPHDEAGEGVLIDAHPRRLLRLGQQGVVYVALGYGHDQRSC
jgi:hypothetical protein